MSLQHESSWFVRAPACLCLVLASSCGDGSSAVESDAALEAGMDSTPEAGEGGLPKTCPAGTFVEEGVIARAIVGAASCVGDDGFWRTQNALRGSRGGWKFPGGKSFVECLAANTTGCAGSLACFGMSPKLPADACGTCVGDVAISCSEGELRMDCAKLGGACVAGKCYGADQPSCPAGVAARCDAEARPSYCAGRTVVSGPACAALGLSCAVTFADTASCVGTGASCTPAFVDDQQRTLDESGIRCEGSQILACVGGREAWLDCSCLGDGFSCQTVGGSTFCGAASECDPRTYTKTCDGKQVVFCNAGKVTKIDCASMGYSACSANAQFACE